MNFKTFMYYCAVCGGWAALLAWAIQQALGFQDDDNLMDAFVKSTLIAGILGLLLAGVIGLLDAMLNAVGFARVVRVIICVAVGLVASLVMGAIGELIHIVLKSRFVGWALVGAVIGASIGVFDILRSVAAGKGLKQSIRKMVNAMLGGLVGGLLGGLLNDAVEMIPGPPASLVTNENGEAYPTLKLWLRKSSLAAGMVILGMCIGLLIGVAQVVLKEAWLKVEKGFRSGREVILSKPETSIGRAEGVDIALFGDMHCEKTHAKIILKSDRYILIDQDTPGGTTVNGQRISGPTPLSNGDLIGCGNSTVRFNEKTKR